MVNVENKKTLNQLTVQFIRMNRGRNTIAILAIILTSLLFTSLFTGVSSMFLTKLEKDKKQYITTSHATIQQLTEKEGQLAEDALKMSGTVEKYGKDLFLGTAEDSHFPYLVELHCGDENSAENRLSLPTEGHMPQKKDEIAVSTTVLDALEIPHTLGEQITLPVSIQEGPVKTETFILCGYWKGDIVSRWQYAWLSEEYAQEIDTLQPSLTYSVWFKSFWNLPQKIQMINELSGLSESGRKSLGFNINPAYEIAFSQEGSISVSSVAALLLLIILAGYLIIYNIFNISVKNDIRTYGLLKNIGTTGKQLKKIVRMQAFILSAIAIPPGLISGYIAGVMFIPILTADLQASEHSTAITTAHPLIFVFSAIFTLITVYLSVLQACNIVKKVSPVEAVRLSENSQTQKKYKKNFSVSWWGIALQNVCDNWKRGIIVMLSIAISLTTLNIIFRMINNADFNSYKELYLATDFQLDKLTSQKDFADFNAISPDIIKTLNVCPYIENTGYVYFSEEQLTMPSHLRETYERITNKYLESWGYDWSDIWNEIYTTNKIPVLYLGITKTVFDKLEWRETKASWKDFESGNYVITGYPYHYAEDNDYFYKQGDSLTINYKNGSEKTYEVLQEAILPMPLDYPYTSLISVTVFVPASEYVTCTGNNSAMRACINALPDMQKETRQYIENNILAEDETLIFTSVLDLKKDFDRYLSKYYIVGGMLALILAFIGIMNFYNTTATSMISRKRELALLEAVGMTRNLLLKMLVAEGILYLAGALPVTFFLTFLYGKRFASTAPEIIYSFIPCLLLIPALLLIAWAIPKYQFQKINRESIVERIRRE